MMEEKKKHERVTGRGSTTASLAVSYIGVIRNTPRHELRC
jgi:hypothetical protein